MMIFALFRNNKYFQCALVQGKNFDEVGDEKFEQETLKLNRIFNHEQNDWCEISAEDFEKYIQGYTRGEDGTPIAPVAVEKTEEEQLQEIQTQFSYDLQELRKEYVNAQMAGIDTTPIQKSYDELVASSNEKAIQVIENAE